MAAKVVNTSAKGRALVAEQTFETGDVILTESPIVSCQFSWNETYQYTACENCLRPLETAEANAKRLTNDPSIALPYPECCTTVPWLAKHTQCAKCGIRYCSEECRSEAATKYHSYLCELSATIAGLIEVWKKMHYPPETTSLMLILRIFAIYKQTSNKAEFLAILNDFQQVSRNDELGTCHKLLGDEFHAKLEELYKATFAVFGNDTDLQHWLTPDGFKTLFVLIGTNGQGIGTTAVGDWAKRVGNLETIGDDDKKKLEQAIDDLYMKIDDFSGQFLNVEGSGLYLRQSKINHSCRPNCEIQFPFSNHTVQVTALQRISPGDEICISYLDECALARSRHSRQKILLENYLFRCQCAKCITELGEQEDRTSSEEEDDDDDDNDMED